MKAGWHVYAVHGTAEGSMRLHAAGMSTAENPGGAAGESRPGARGSGKTPSQTYTVYARFPNTFVVGALRAIKGASSFSGSWALNELGSC